MLHTKKKFSSFVIWLCVPVWRKSKKSKFWSPDAESTASVNSMSLSYDIQSVPLQCAVPRNEIFYRDEWLCITLFLCSDNNAAFEQRAVYSKNIKWFYIKPFLSNLISKELTFISSP